MPRKARQTRKPTQKKKLKFRVKLTAFFFLTRSIRFAAKRRDPTKQ